MKAAHVLCVLAVAIAVTIDVPAKDLVPRAVVAERSLSSSSADAARTDIERECQQAAAREIAIQRASAGPRTSREEALDECIAVKTADRQQTED